MPRRIPVLWLLLGVVCIRSQRRRHQEDKIGELSEMYGIY